jgi:hypothetical protein
MSNIFFLKNKPQWVLIDSEAFDKTTRYYNEFNDNLVSEIVQALNLPNISECLDFSGYKVTGKKGNVSFKIVVRGFFYRHTGHPKLLRKRISIASNRGKYGMYFRKDRLTNMIQGLSVFFDEKVLEDKADSHAAKVSREQLENLKKRTGILHDSKDNIFNNSDGFSLTLHFQDEEELVAAYNLLRNVLV